MISFHYVFGDDYANAAWIFSAIQGEVLVFLRLKRGFPPLNGKFSGAQRVLE